MQEELGNFPHEEMPAIGIMGIRNSGKSKLAIAIIRAMKHRFAHAVLICPSQTAKNKVFGNIFAPVFTHSEPTEEVLQALIDRQQGILHDEDSTLTPYEEAVLLVLDDVGAYPKLMKSEPMKQVLANGRNWRITIIVTAQYFNQLLPDVRGNMTYLFTLQEASMSVIRKLWIEFFTVFKTVGELRDVMMEFTVDYGCLVAKKRQGKTASISERVFWYKADKTEIEPDFQVGSDLYWLINECMGLTREEKRQKYLINSNPVMSLDAPPMGTKSKYRRGASKAKSSRAAQQQQQQEREEAAMETSSAPVQHTQHRSHQEPRPSPESGSAPMASLRPVAFLPHDHHQAPILYYAPAPPPPAYQSAY